MWENSKDIYYFEFSRSELSRSKDKRERGNHFIFCHSLPCFSIYPGRNNTICILYFKRVRRQLSYLNIYVHSIYTRRSSIPIFHNFGLLHISRRFFFASMYKQVSSVSQCFNLSNFVLKDQASLCSRFFSVCKVSHSPNCTF